jgi:hypothetical protein
MNSKSKTARTTSVALNSALLTGILYAQEPSSIKHALEVYDEGIPQTYKSFFSSEVRQGRLLQKLLNGISKLGKPSKPPETIWEYLLPPIEERMPEDPESAPIYLLDLIEESLDQHCKAYGLLELAANSRDGKIPSYVSVMNSLKNNGKISLGRLDPLENIEMRLNANIITRSGETRPAMLASFEGPQFERGKAQQRSTEYQLLLPIVGQHWGVKHEFDGELHTYGNCPDLAGTPILRMRRTGIETSGWIELSNPDPTYVTVNPQVKAMRLFGAIASVESEGPTSREGFPPQ